MLCSSSSLRNWSVLWWKWANAALFAVIYLSAKCILSLSWSRHIRKIKHFGGMCIGCEVQSRAWKQIKARIWTNKLIWWTEGLGIISGKFGGRLKTFLFAKLGFFICKISLSLLHLVLLQMQHIVWGLWKEPIFNFMKWVQIIVKSVLGL